MQEYVIRNHFKRVGGLPFHLASKTSVCVSDYIVELKIEDQTIRITQQNNFVKKMKVDCATNELHGFIGEIWDEDMGFSISIKRKGLLDRLLIVKYNNNVWAETINKHFCQRHHLRWLHLKKSIDTNNSVLLVASYKDQYSYLGLVVVAIVGAYYLHQESI